MTRHHAQATLKTMSKTGKQVTLAVAAQAAEQEFRESLMRLHWTPPQLALRAADLFRAIGGRPSPRWSKDPLWLAAFAVVIHRCDETGIDERVWLRAVVHARGAVAVQQSWGLRPGHFSSDKAQDCVQRWMRAYSTEQVLAPDVWSNKIAEIKFAYEFLEGDESVSMVEARTQAKHPDWNLRSSDDYPHVRLEALKTGVEMRWSGLSVLIPAPREGWLWRYERVRVREFARAQEAARPRPERRGSYYDLDPELGDPL